MGKEVEIREFLLWWLTISLGSFHKTVFFQEEDYRELVSISHNMEEQYGQFFDSVIPFEEVEFVLKQLMYEISLLEREPQWVPAKWVEETQTQYNSY